MAILTVRTLGDPILRSRSAEIDAFDDALARLAGDMFETMDEAPGVGLAAPQVGRPIRLFVYDSHNDEEETDPERGSLCNPVIEWSSDETAEMEEGCLSIPGAYYPVTRPAAVRVVGRALSGEAVRVEAEGFLARIFQHEIDHLDGILFIDRLDPEVRREAMKALREQDFGMAPPPAPRTAI